MALTYNNEPVKWTNEGTAPSDNLKTNGFQAGYKPPAAVFNNQWHVTGECIDELQNKLSDENTARTTHESNKSNPHGVTKAQVGLGNVDNTSDANKPISSATQTALNGKAPTSHTSTATTYGVGTSTYYGHLKLADDLATTTSGTALSANQGKILNNAIKNKCNIKRNDTYGADGNIVVGDILNGALTVGVRVINASGVDKYAGSPSLTVGTSNVASAKDCAAIGNGAEASAICSLAIGSNSIASGPYSVSMGAGTTASGEYSVVAGFQNTALESQFKIGHYAKDGAAGISIGTTGDAFIIGNGTADSTRSNCFRVTYSGNVYGLSTFKATGADYAEYFEWKDGNPDNEDRRGRLVTLDGDKIRFATAEDTYILGVISAAPCVEGDVYSDDWQGKYLTDVFGQRLTQTVHIPARYEEIQTIDPETGEIVTENILVEDEHDSVQWILNPEYDPEKEYVSREDRKEWSAIGLMGKLVVIDDGTCEVNGYCKAGVNGIATKADDGYRVMARIDDTHIRVLVR